MDKAFTTALISLRIRPETRANLKGRDAASTLGIKNEEIRLARVEEQVAALPRLQHRLGDAYLAADQDAWTKCGAPWAPGHAIPADRKWVRDLAVATLVRRELEEMNSRFPQPVHDLSMSRIA